MAYTALPITLTERQARLVWEVLLTELGADPAEGEAFVAACVSGVETKVSFHAQWLEVDEDDQRSMRVSYDRSEFSLHEGPLRVLCSEQMVSTNQIWAAESVSHVFQEALKRQAEEDLLPRAFQSLRPSALSGEAVSRPKAKLAAKPLVRYRSQKLAAPVSGATKLYRNEQKFHDDDPKRFKKGAYVRYADDFVDGNEQFEVYLIEWTGELVAVRTHRDGQALEWDEKQHELLGALRDRDGEPLRDVLSFRTRAGELIRGGDGTLATLRRHFVASEILARVFASEQAFVEAGDRCYPQMDYGFNWREGGEYYRVSLVPESGEVIAVLRGNGRTELLGRVESPEALKEILKPLWRLSGKRESLARVRGALAHTLDKPRPERARRSALSQPVSRLALG